MRRFDPGAGQFILYRHTVDRPGSLSSDRVNSICIDSAGTVWAGTQNGLDRFDRATRAFSTFDEHDGLPNSTVIGILGDKRGNLWLGTNNGLSRFTPSAGTFRNYYASDGLPGNEFNGYGTAFKSSSGEMFFCSYSGLLTFFPDEVVDSTYIPPVVVTDFRLFGNPVPVGPHSPLKQPISYTGSITLSHTQNIFSFEFSALSYAGPERNRYRYRLEGLEKQWNETDSTRRFASYTTLPPGDYVFRVQGSNNQGIWNEKGASVRIRILPPWWSTWWFITVAASLILLSLGSAYYFQLQSIQREFNVRLEERVNERTRIARELHDTLLQSFQGLMLRFQVVDNLLPPGKAKETLGRALERADQAIVEGRDSIQDLRPLTELASDLAQAVTALGHEVAPEESDADSPAFRVMVEGPPRNLHPILRDEIYRIAREALRNAYRHAQASRIEAEITYSDRLFRLRIRDDGRPRCGRSERLWFPPSQGRTANFNAFERVTTAAAASTHHNATTLQRGITFRRCPQWWAGSCLDCR